MEKLKKYNLVNTLPKFLNLIQRVLNFSSLFFVFLSLIYLFNISVAANEEAV